MRYIWFLLVCFVDFILAHIDEIWVYNEGNVQNIIFFAANGLRMALLFTYVILIGFHILKPLKWQLYGFSFYAIFAIFEYLLFLFGQI